MLFELILESEHTKEKDASRCRKKRRAKTRESREDLLIPMRSPPLYAFRTTHKNKQRQNIKQGALYVSLFIFPISGRAECPNAFRNIYTKEVSLFQSPASGPTIAILSKYIPAICMKINATGLPHRGLKKFSMIPKKRRGLEIFLKLNENVKLTRLLKRFSALHS